MTITTVDRAYRIKLVNWYWALGSAENCDLQVVQAGIKAKLQIACFIAPYTSRRAVGMSVAATNGLTASPYLEEHVPSGIGRG